MAEAEPFCKKTKSDKCVVTKEQIDDISNRLKMLTDYVLAIENTFITHACPGFSFLKIVESNAENSCYFSSALCRTNVNLCDEYASEEKKCYLPFKQLFNVKLLNDVVHQRDGLEKKLRKEQFLALEKLADFLHTKSEHEDSFRRTSPAKYLKDVEWAKVISVHLLSKLAVEKDVSLDDEYAKSGKHCPCYCGTELMFQDNSMGQRDVWHGSVDILVGRSVAVTTSVCGDEDASVSNQNDTNSSYRGFESNVVKFNIDQVLAGTIVSSITQTDRDLAPTVVITKDEMRVYIYEKKHDLLLESMPIRIFDGDSFNPVFVLSLWLTLNYRYFIDETMFMKLKPDEERLLYHAEFFEDMPEDRQEIYQQCLRFTGCKRVPRESQTNMERILRATPLPISFVPVDDEQ